MMDEPYFKTIKSWEYSSFKEAILKAIDITKEQETEDWGMTQVFISKLEDIELLPSHGFKYFVDDKEVDLFEYECADIDRECYRQSVVTHHVGWTENLGIENNMRLFLTYTNNVEYSDDYIDEFYREINDKAFSQTIPLVWSRTPSGCNDNYAPCGILTNRSLIAKHLDTFSGLR